MPADVVARIQLQAIDVEEIDDVAAEAEVIHHIGESIRVREAERVTDLMQAGEIDDRLAKQRIGTRRVRDVRAQRIGVGTHIDLGAANAVESAPEHLRASLTADRPTQVRVAINDFPAWSASVNGKTVQIRRDDDGYMLIDVPAGESDLDLTYTIEPVVWLGRSLTALGVFVLIAAAIIERRRMKLAVSS